MRVLFALDTFPFYGASESLGFALGLQGRGHAVRVVTSDRLADGRPNPRADRGVATAYLPSFRLPGLPYLVTPSSLPALLSEVRSFRPDVVLAMHYVHFTTNMAVLAARLAGVPAVLGIRGPGAAFGAAFPNALKANLSRTLGRATRGLSRAVIFDCAASAAAYGAPRSSVVYTPVDASRFRPGPGDGGRTVAYVGSLTPTKGLGTLMEAARLAPAARVLVAGEGTERGKLEAAAPPNVEFLGYRGDVQAVLDLADVFVLPSVSEGVSIALLEAGACGLACVASDVGGNPEVITDGWDGLLFPPGDARALAATLRMLLRDSGLRGLYGGRLREKVLDVFDLGRVTGSLERVLLAAAA